MLDDQTTWSTTLYRSRHIAHELEVVSLSDPSGEICSTGPSSILSFLILILISSGSLLF